MNDTSRTPGGVSIEDAQKMICRGTYGAPGTTYTNVQRQEACKRYEEMTGAKATDNSAVVVVLVSVSIIAALVFIYIVRLLRKPKELQKR